MSDNYLEQVHEHKCLDFSIRPEYCEEGRLHRHRINLPGGRIQFTTWSHNGEHHSHRLPGGGWTRPRLDLSPNIDRKPVKPPYPTAGMGRLAWETSGGLASAQEAPEIGEAPAEYVAEDTLILEPTPHQFPALAMEVARLVPADYVPPAA